jgi:outer membrane protein OmpA-like peptidoglycan-associated protein
MRNKWLCSLIGLAVGACASTQHGSPVGLKSEARLAVVQAPTQSAGNWEACRDCPPLTEKRAVIVLPPPPVQKKPAAVLRNDGVSPAEVVESPIAQPQPISPRTKRYSVHFAYASASLDRRAKAALLGAVEELRQSAVVAEVLGRTDPRGLARFNQALAVKRAAAVRDYLTSQGVSASRLSVRAYDPCCDGPTDASELEMWDRRRSDVEILIEHSPSRATQKEQQHASQHVRGK